MTRPLPAWSNTALQQKTKTEDKSIFYNFVVYWPPFHVFHINLDMMECFVKFPSPLYSCQTRLLALLKPPLPAKHTVHSFSCSWTTRKYEPFNSSHSNFFTPFTQHTMHSLTHAHKPLRQQGCWVEPKGMQEVQYGWGVGLCNGSLPASDIIDTSLRPTWPVNRTNLCLLK